MMRQLYGSVFRRSFRTQSTNSHAHAYAQSILPHHRLRLLAIGSASAIIATTYLTWRIGGSSHAIKLDSNPPHPSQEALSSPNADTNVPESSSSPLPTHLDSTEAPTDAEETIEQKAEETEEDSGEGGAFNPVTGEINWDCPCLGGMAQGICGAQFREAFSCFVYSEDEPKGIHCVDKFKAMQDCFREHPDIYGEEIMEEDDEEIEMPAETGDDPLPSAPMASTPAVPLSSLEETADDSKLL